MRRRVVVGLILAVPVALGVGVGCCTPQLVRAAMKPGDAFDPQQTPPAPRYDDDAAWLALPQTVDEADVALPGAPAVAVADARADVFFLHSTSSVAPRWNADANDPEVRVASIRGGTLIQASAYNGSGVVYAPTYRQASGDAFTAPSPDGDRALDVAYSDVARAFASFQARRDNARPFFVVGHSQGGVLGARLVREKIAGTPLQERLVLAALIGAPLVDGDTGAVVPCASPDDVGCLLTFNARGPGHVEDQLRSEAEQMGNSQGQAEGIGQFDLRPRRPGGTTLSVTKRLCVNPTLGRTGADVVPAAQHGGAVFFDAEAPALIPAFLQSACRDGALVVTGLKPLPDRGAPSSILLWVMGGENYHPVEFQLFYVDLRQDAARRLKAFEARSPAPL